MTTEPETTEPRPNITIPCDCPFCGNWEIEIVSVTNLRCSDCEEEFEPELAGVRVGDLKAYIAADDLDWEADPRGLTEGDLVAHYDRVIGPRVAAAELEVYERYRAGRTEDKVRITLTDEPETDGGREVIERRRQKWASYLGPDRGAEWATPEPPIGINRTWASKTSEEIIADVERLVRDISGADGPVVVDEPAVDPSITLLTGRRAGKTRSAVAAIGHALGCDLTDESEATTLVEVPPNPDGTPGVLTDWRSRVIVMVDGRPAEMSMREAADREFARLGITGTSEPPVTIVRMDGTRVELPIGGGSPAPERAFEYAGDPEHVPNEPPAPPMCRCFAEPTDDATRYGIKVRAATTDEAAAHARALPNEGSPEPGRVREYMIDGHVFIDVDDGHRCTRCTMHVDRGQAIPSPCPGYANPVDADGEPYPDLPMSEGVMLPLIPPAPGDPAPEPEFTFVRGPNEPDDGFYDRMHARAGSPRMLVLSTPKAPTWAWHEKTAPSVVDPFACTFTNVKITRPAGGLYGALDPESPSILPPSDVEDIERRIREHRAMLEDPTRRRQLALAAAAEAMKMPIYTLVPVEQKPGTVRMYDASGTLLGEFEVPPDFWSSFGGKAGT